MSKNPWHAKSKLTELTSGDGAAKEGQSEEKNAISAWLEETEYSDQRGNNWVQTNLNINLGAKHYIFYDIKEVDGHPEWLEHLEEELAEGESALESHKMFEASGVEEFLLV